MFWNEKFETIKGKDLKDLQLKRLKETISRTQNIAFYRDMFKKAGIKPDDIKSREGITKIPFTRKSDLRDRYPFNFLALPLN